MEASLEDIEKELWLRRRNANELIWTTKDGKRMSIREMTTQHLENILKYFANKEEIWCDEGDIVNIEECGDR